MRNARCRRVGGRGRTKAPQGGVFCILFFAGEEKYAGGGYKNLLSLKSKRGDGIPPYKKVKEQKLTTIMTNNYFISSIL